MVPLLSYPGSKHRACATTRAAPAAAPAADDDSVAMYVANKSLQLET